MNLTSTLLVLDRKETSIDLQALQDCREINDYLQHILLDDGTQLRSIFSALQPIIENQSTLRGPKKFRKLLDSIFDFMKRYSYSRIENYEQHSVILSLTYYLKIFKQFLTTNQKIQTDIIFAVSNIHLYLRNDEVKRLNSAQDKVLDIGQILAVASKSKEQKNYQYYKNIYTLLTALIAYLRGMFKKAQTIFGSFFTKLTSQHKEVISSQHNMEIMSVTAYYSHLNLLKLGQHELSCYYLTKALQFATKTGLKAEQFIKKIKEVGSEKAIRVVKLTRIQNKLQVLNRTRSSWHSRQMKPKLYNKKQKIDQNVVSQELKSIFTIKDKKVTMYRLRKQNMKYLVKQENKLTLNIQRKQEQLGNICKMRQKLQAATEINAVQKLIDELLKEKKYIRSQYIELKDQYLNKLKQVGTIRRYFCGFANLVAYRKCKYVYDFLYGEMFSRAKIFLLSLFMKRRVKKVKKTAKTLKVTINGIKHFVQLFEIISFNGELLIYKKKQPGFYIKIYPLQHPRNPKISPTAIPIPINDEKKIQKQTLQKLLDIPLCYEFNYCNGKLMSWDEYLSKKSFLTIHYVKKFIQRLTKRYKNRDNRSVYHVVGVAVKFGSYVSVQMRVFVNVVSYCREEEKQIEKNDSQDQIQPNQTRQQASNLTIFTIGGQRYSNNLYNININKQLCLQRIVDLQNLVTNLVKKELITNFLQHIKEIIKLQKFIKLCNCRRKINKMKLKNKISVFVHGHDIITFCKYSMGKSFIIAENIVTKDREIVETIMDFQSFQHISLIKDKLFKERTCKDKLKLTCKYIWTKFFISKLRTQYKTTTILTEFQVDFRNRVIFYKMFNNYIYKKKPIHGRIVFSLVVESLLEFPRPYILRIFTINRQTAMIDIKKRIYNRQKLFYEKNIENLYKLVNVSSKTQMETINEAQQNEMKTNRRRNSRASRRSSRKESFLMNKIPNASSEDEVKSTIQQPQVSPKVISKKASMLIRFRQRRSNQLRSEQNMFERSSRTPSTYSMKNKEEVDI